MSRGFKILVIVFLLVLVVCGIVYFTTDVEEEKTKDKEITSEDLLKMKSNIPKGLVIQNETISVNHGRLLLNASIYNKGEKRKIKSVEIIIQNGSNEIVSDIILQINSTIEKDRIIDLKASDDVLYNGNDLQIKYVFE